MFIEGKNLVKKYGKGEATVFALDHAEFGVEKGEIVVILGPSGSGKSTLLNILGGLDKVTEGSMLVDGTDLEKMSAKELEYMAGRITRMLEGKAVTDIDKALLDEVQAAVKDDRLLLSSLLHVLRRMTRPEKETFFMGGTRQLLSQPEFRDMEKVKNLLGVLEEEKVVRNILKSGEESGLRITIGSENKFEGIQDCSMVQATYRLNGKIVGTMAVLGPTRMQYGKVIAVMDYLHKYLKTILNS